MTKYYDSNMRNLIILFCFILGIQNSFAQSEKLQAMEDELVFIQHTAAKMWNSMLNSNYADKEYVVHGNYDNMVNLLCGQFDSMLNQMLIEDKDMNYAFSKLQAQEGQLLGTHIVYSADSLLRVFSWELPGGTQHIYGNAIQYKDANSSVRSFSFENNSDSNNTGYDYDIVYTLKEKDKIIYILSGSTKGQSHYPIYGLTAVGVQNELVPKNIFEDKQGNATNEISVGYDIGCSYENFTDSENFPRPTIDEKGKIMNFLEIKADCFTGKLIKYKFDDKKRRFTK
jgi:hypothetical protein